MTNKVSNSVNLIVGLVTVGAVIGGVVWLTGAMNRKRLRKIADFVGFDPNYWQGRATLSSSRAKHLADVMYDSVGYVNDNEEAMLGVIKEARTAANLSYISHYFQVRHGESMGGWVADYLDRRTESKQVIDALKNLER